MVFIKKETGFYNSFDGTPIYYECRGEGKPLVFIYGIACSMNHWMKQIQYFSLSYKTIIIDLRGHFKSSNIKDSSSMKVESMAHDIHALLKFLNIKKALFIGHSFGVQVLITTYKFYPHLFHACVFVNGFVSYPLKTMKNGFLLHFVFFVLKSVYRYLPGLCAWIWKLCFRSRLCIWFSGLVGGFNLKLVEIKDVEIYFQGIAQFNLNYFILIFQDLIQYNNFQVLNQLDQPCLVVSGKKDALTPERVQFSIYRELKAGEYVTFPNGTHSTPLDEPGLFNRCVEKFLEKCT